MTKQDIVNILKYDGYSEASEYFPKAYYFNAEGENIARDIFNTLTESDIDEWSAEFELEANELKVSGVTVSVEDGENAQNIGVALEVKDKDNNLAELEPYEVEIGTVGDDFVRELLAKVEDD